METKGGIRQAQFVDRKIGGATAVVDHASDDWNGDPRWQLVQQIVASAQFARSPLMSRFLLFVVTETLAGRQGSITEHAIGVQVFRRPPTYRTDEDNIVRNYARQLRKRLAEYFAASKGPISLTIPVGGYVPVFIHTPENSAHTLTEPTGRGVDGLDAAFEIQPADTVPASQAATAVQGTSWMVGQRVPRLVALLLYSVALIGVTWLVATRAPLSHPPTDPAHALWEALFSSSSNTYIVPPDEGLNLIEDIAHHPLPLAEYIKGTYLDQPLANLDNHTRQDLRTQQFSDFTSAQIVAAIAREPAYNPQRVFMRFPRDLRLDDLKSANAILIGSTSSNPWASIADGGTNFRIVPGTDMVGATITNASPERGEAASYASHWNEPSHATYAVIAFVPNLGGNGHLLLLEGLDVAGTQAAAELLLHGDAIAPILKQATRPDGSLRSFEILLRATSIQSSAAGTQIVSVRIH